MPDYPFLVPCWWLLAELAGYFAHRMMHQRFVREHEDHHMINYPPTDFYSTVYRQPAGANTWKQNLWYILGGLAGTIAVFFWLDWKHAATFLLTAGVTAALNHYIHNSMHITDHWLGRFVLTRWWFRWIQGRHLIHHIELHKNLGMYNYVWDTLLRSKTITVREDWKASSPWADRDRVMK